MLTLRDAQLRFFAALGAAERDPILLELIQDDGVLGPAARLEIYAGMYRARLLDVLREDFPRTLAVVGDDGFAALASGYLDRVPSRNPSVRHAGQRFADFLETEPTTPAFLADLARLEWARVEVFDAADAAPLLLVTRAEHLISLSRQPLAQPRRDQSNSLSDRVDPD